MWGAVSYWRNGLSFAATTAVSWCVCVALAFITLTVNSSTQRTIVLTINTSSSVYPVPVLNIAREMLAHSLLSQTTLCMKQRNPKQLTVVAAINQSGATWQGKF